MRSAPLVLVAGLTLAVAGAGAPPPAARAADAKPPTLESALAEAASNDPEVRRRGAADLDRVLAGTTPTPSALERIREALHAKAAETRAEIVRALGRAGGADAERLWI